MAYSSIINGNEEIRLIEIATFTITPLYHGGRQPRWSPDGQKILFSNTRTPNTPIVNIMIMNKDGSDPRPLTNSDADNWDPAMSDKFRASP